MQWGDYCRHILHISLPRTKIVPTVYNLIYFFNFFSTYGLLAHRWVNHSADKINWSILFSYCNESHSGNELCEKSRNDRVDSYGADVVQRVVLENAAEDSHDCQKNAQDVALEVIALAQVMLSGFNQDFLGSWSVIQLETSGFIRLISGSRHDSTNCLE